MSGCGCGGATAANGMPLANKVFVHNKPDGTSDVYQSEVEVAAAVSRQGGSYRIGD